ncbi:MAG: hypothetical protein ACFFC7_05295 [Candidatus Hermodarchaeota archaeon]
MNSYVFNIHGVIHRVRIRVINNEWHFEIIGPGGYVEASKKLPNINSHTLKSALRKAVKEVDIDHQITDLAVDALVESIQKKLGSEGMKDENGQLPEEKREILLSDELGKIKNSLDKVLMQLEELSLRLERIEGRIGL